MTISTLFRYLIGSRAAILEIAASKWSPLIGAIFVLSAGLAREYDGEDLVHEPWHALRPLAASLVSGTVLFLLVHGAALMRKRDERVVPPFFRAYHSFMGLFWMTAPMAWLYAIPYERFLSPVEAMGCNLWTLAIVAAWRVVLMTRVVSVVYGIHAAASFFFVMLFADVVVFAAVSLAPTPVLDVMGGIRQSERDQILGNVTFFTLFFAVISAPLWLIGAIIAVCKIRPKWMEIPSAVPGAGCGLLKAAILSLLVFVPLLWIGQPEQINRRRVEKSIAAGRCAEALAFMSAREPADFPPVWDPPPKVIHDKSNADLARIRNAMTDTWPAPWVAQMYVRKMAYQLISELSRGAEVGEWPEVAVVAESRGAQLTAEHRAAARFLLDHDSTLTEADRTALETLSRRGAPLPDAAEPGTEDRFIPDL